MPDDRTAPPVADVVIVGGSVAGLESMLALRELAGDRARLTLVTPDSEIPEGMLALGAPAKVRGPLAGTPAEFWVRANPAAYQALAQRHRAGVAPA